VYRRSRSTTTNDPKDTSNLIKCDLLHLIDDTEVEDADVEADIETARATTSAVEDRIRTTEPFGHRSQKTSMNEDKH
jgi:hypothetical protein